MSTGELTTKCFKSSYTLQASSLQMAVLLQYNFALSFTAQQLQESTGLEMSALQSVLRTLLKCKLLVSSKQTEADCELLPDAVLSLSEDYSNNKLCVNINVPLESEHKIVQEATYTRVDHDRNAAIQASIVRIMKERKTLQQQELITEVSRRLCSMFQPSVAIIRDCIDILVRKEYIEKVEGEQDAYNYI
ncbi:hypothetical protein HPB48_009496 [Haemaphysalis longicornis]|uniref:Cullin family profile domain-containing protein n=1 Tax=Haemaphysalis longicornis TaxID=44386 RepID=A0A9J6GE64_HAELO|nr:hypothetical protein HPB48_009496 [Haemaphysalis longicornis]